MFKLSGMGSSSTAPGGADKDIQYNDSGVFGGESNWTYDKTNNYVNLGPVDIRTVGQANHSKAIGVASESGFRSDIAMVCAGGNPPQLWLMSQEGTLASPTHSVTNGELGIITFAGRGATTHGVGVYLQAFADEEWSDTNHGAKFRIQTVASGGATLVDRLRLGKLELPSFVGADDCVFVIKTSKATNPGIADGDWWVEAVGTSPSRVAALKLRDGLTTRTIASITY